MEGKEMEEEIKDMTPKLIKDLGLRFIPRGDRRRTYGLFECQYCGEEWLDVRNFVAWGESTHPNTEGYTLDRIDVNGNYEPSNCRWADRTTQNINQRMKKNNTSGFVGVSWDKTHQFWLSYIHLNKKRYNIGSFKTIEEAVQARDNYIIENKFPHKLSTEYKKEGN